MENSQNRNTATVVECKSAAGMTNFSAGNFFFRTITATLAVLFYLMICFAGPLRAQATGDTYRTEIFRSIEAPRVDISTQGGFIEVAGTNDDDVIVEMFVRRGSRYLKPDEEDLSDYTIEIARNGNNIVISAEQEGSFFRRGRSISVSFRVHLPYSAEVDARTSGGNVSAEYIRNNLTLRTSGGRIRAVDIQADRVDLRTSGGAIELGRVAGNIEARTSGGSIRGEVLTGQTDLRTSGGSIQLSDVSGGLSARTSGGRITADVTRFQDDIHLRTSGGSIEIKLADVRDFDIDLQGSRVNTELQNFTGKAERSHVHGRIGRGGPLLNARTSGGSVTLIY